jgi:hypothetical protein
LWVAYNAAMSRQYIYSFLAITSFVLLLLQVRYLLFTVYGGDPRYEPEAFATYVMIVVYSSLGILFTWCALRSKTNRG